MAHVLPSEGDVGRWNNAARKIESLRISGDVDVTSSPSQMTVVVRPRTQQQSAAQQARPASPGYWFELTGAFNASTGYPWKRLVADGTGTDFTDASPADTGSYLFDPNGNETRTSGERVFVRPHGTVSGNPSYMIVAGAGGGSSITKLQVTAIANDYLTCEPIGGGTPIYVAKPYELRHTAANYGSHIATLTTENAQQVLVVDEEDFQERWKVGLPYLVGAPIFAASSPNELIVTPGVIECHRVDLNVAARAWTLVLNP
jgi:hypothetical protein